MTPFSFTLKLNLFLGVVFYWLAVMTLNAAFVPVDLRCEYRANPMGIDAAKPRLSWCEKSSKRGAKQTASRILVASNPTLLKENIGDLWDAGKVVGDQEARVIYAGKPLTSRQPCFWKVCIWDTDEKTHWSDVASWTMGLVNPEDWSAKWIGLNKANGNSSANN